VVEDVADRRDVDGRTHLEVVQLLVNLVADTLEFVVLEIVEHLLVIRMQYLLNDHHVLLFTLVIIIVLLVLSLHKIVGQLVLFRGLMRPVLFEGSHRLDCLLTLQEILLVVIGQINLIAFLFHSLL
jgi:hypothetical protein